MYYVRQINVAKSARHSKVCFYANKTVRQTKKNGKNNILYKSSDISISKLIFRSEKHNISQMLFDLK